MKYGANPDLRDEDGKTPLDRARERNDEGHREVAAILQSPAEWLVSVESKVFFLFSILLVAFYETILLNLSVLILVRATVNFLIQL